MSLSQVADNGGSAIQIIPCVLSTGKLDDTFGTVIDLNVIGDHDIQYPLTSSESSDERNEVQLIHGVTLSKAKVTKVIDTSGNEVTTSSGGGAGDSHQLVVNCYEQDLTFINSIVALRSTPVIIWCPVGQTTTDGYAWLLCVLDGTLSLKRSGNTFNAVQLTFKGKAYELDTGVTAAGFITALDAKVSTIAQPGFDSSYDLDPTDGPLVAGDIANPGLLAGTWVFKA